MPQNSLQCVEGRNFDKPWSVKASAFTVQANFGEHHNETEYLVCKNKTNLWSLFSGRPKPSGTMPALRRMLPSAHTLLVFETAA